MNAAKKKAKKFKETLGEAFQMIDELIALIKAFKSGKIKISASTVAMIIGAIVYFFVPFDAIPDFAPIVGFIDDITVIMMIYKKVRDLIKYAKRKKII